MKILALLVTILMVVGCAPRGESKSLTEIIEAGKARYMAAKGVKLSDDIQSKLTSLTSKLDDALSAAQSGNINSVTLSQIDEMLSDMVGHAGVTARAGINQLAKQYRELSSSEGGVNSGAVGLLVGRTYSAIGAELETTKFGL